MKKIGKYEVLRQIGQGSFGKVFLVSLDGQQFALKAIPKKNKSVKEFRSLSEETQLLMKLKHSNIIAMRETF
jgi:serine/threonine protein kinase